MSDWWESFFDEPFADLVLAREEGVAAEVAFLFDRLHLGTGARVLDQCCGIGRLALPLARRGCRVVGVDQAALYVERARAAAKRDGLACEFFAADAGAFVPARLCDAAFNWFTSFGYSEDDARNAALLRCAFESLAPGGRFALDYANMPRVMREFKDCILTRHPTPEGELLVVRESRLDLARGMLENRWTYVLPDGARRVREGSIRIYLPHVLAAMVRACGFADVQVLGGVGGEPIGPASQRCVLLARKP